MAILSEEMIERMRKHRFLREGFSILDTYLNPLFQSMAKCIPKKISPNAVTLLGLVSVCLPCTLIIYQTDVGQRDDAQATAYFCLFGFFMWLISDNVDGILARLRCVCGPFGEVLDHGGDAVAIALSSAAVAIYLSLQETPLLAIAWILSDVITNYIVEPYYLYVFGKVLTEGMDFCEVMIIYMTLSFVTARYGFETWLLPIFPSMGFQYRHIFYVVKLYITVDLAVGHSYKLHKKTKESEWSPALLLKPLLPPLIVLVFALIGYVSSSEEFLQKHAILFSLIYAFSVVKQHLELMVVKMTSTDTNLFNYSLLIPIVHAFGISFCHTPDIEMKYTCLFLTLVFTDTAVYLCRLLYEIYHAMDTRFFILDDKLPNEKKTNN